jgi:hypothetical protein
MNYYLNFTLIVLMKAVAILWLFLMALLSIPVILGLFAFFAISTMTDGALSIMAQPLPKKSD